MIRPNNLLEHVGCDDVEGKVHETRGLHVLHELGEDRTDRRSFRCVCVCVRVRV
jgi:hypothetical protein